MDPMSNRVTRTCLAVAAAIWLPLAASAQGTDVAFAGLKGDSSAPVEIESDKLEVNQAEGFAIFTGNVRVKQGPMRMAAPQMRVDQVAGGTGIERIHATGGVTLANGAEAAESREATYTVSTGEIVMTTDVLLTQGANTIAGQRLVFDIDSGTGRMEGRVQTVYKPGSGQ
nr:lipopolysaccharide transport periplasmic protein LptA [Cereibacter ovatus]